LKNLVEKTKNTALLRGFGLWKIPMIWYVSPTVQELTDERTIIKIPLTRKTKNHFRSMYFGALAVGADCAGGLLAMHHIQNSKRKVSFIFKDFHADFLKRPDGDVDFVCSEGDKVKEAVEKAISTGERQNVTAEVRAFLHSSHSREMEECVAKFQLTISLKLKS
jgi:acyl-coenzyme A thioesterase PaaI-like protein